MAQKRPDLNAEDCSAIEESPGGPASDELGDRTVTLRPNQRPAVLTVKSRRRRSEIPYPDAPGWAIMPGEDWPRQNRRKVRLDGLPQRYRFGSEIGRGGQGRILTIFDTDIGRPLAMKTVLAGPNATDEDVRRFIQEVQVTGQLEHPNIIPVHELGQLARGEIFYTMKLVQGRSLAEVIRRLQAGDRQATQEFGRVRLMTILQQTCLGVAYANARGVVHRDLKPSNIMLGDFGEVTVMDWGCAKVRGAEGVDSSCELRPVVTERSALDDRTVVGSVQGTPAYMAPEQASGQSERIDERTDVYALGAILYEILTFRPPIQGRDISAKLEAVVNDPIIPPRQRAPALDVPVELEEICLKCMEKDPDNRFSSALELHAALEAYLEGTLARERQSREAERIAKGGIELSKAYSASCEELERLLRRRRSLELQIEPWEPASAKSRLWGCIRQIDRVQIRRVTTFGEAVKAFHQALSHDPTNAEARRGLADLYWSQFVDAEKKGRERSDVLYFEGLVREFDDGRYSEALRGDGRLSLRTEPSGIKVRLCKYREVGQRLKPTPGRDIGKTPFRKLKLPRGSYTLVLSGEGFCDTRVPVLIGRGEDVSLDVAPLAVGELPESYVHVPAGRFIRGGDEQAPGGGEPRVDWLDDYAISRFPVTCEQYLAFVNHLAKVAPDEARQRVPRSSDHQGYYWSRDEAGGYRLPESCPWFGRWKPDWPVHSVSWEDATAYCRWRSELEGTEVRLPREAEWEKAGRGVDGRFFSWGNVFDASFCKMRESREEAALPETVGCFETDTSPFGVRDMAGCVTEWCLDWFNQKQGLRLVKGGAWNSTSARCRLARCHGEAAKEVLSWVGFRVVRPLK